MDVLNVRKILIVDDEAGIREILVELLASLGTQISTASDGVQALDMLQNENFDLVLCDITMPGLTGLELLAKVRQLAIPSTFVMLTGAGEREKILEALRLGAIDFLDKPFDAEKLHATMTNLLEVGARRLMLHKTIKNLGAEELKKVESIEKLASLFQLKNNLTRAK